MTDQGIMVGRSKHSFVCSCSALEPRCIARSGGTPERIIEVPGRVSGIGNDDVGSSVFKILASKFRQVRGEIQSTSIGIARRT